MHLLILCNDILFQTIKKNLYFNCIFVGLLKNLSNLKILDSIYYNNYYDRLIKKIIEIQKRKFSNQFSMRNKRKNILEICIIGYIIFPRLSF